MKKLIYSTLVTLLFCVSCSKEFVEIPPVGDIDAATFFNDESNTEQAIIGLYDLIQYNYAKDWSSAYFVKMLPGDDVNCGGGSSEDQSQLQDIDQYTDISISNGSLTSVWNLHYRTIALANTIIQYVEAGDLATKEYVLAEAKFMRAWCYFELTTQWGAVPLRLTNPTEISSAAFAMPKSSREEIYAQVEADLKDAIEGLPSRGELTHNFRVSNATAQALMGKVLVYQGKYPQAIPYLEAVILNPAYDLVPDPSAVWSVPEEFGIESLFEIGYISTNGYDWGNVAWGGRMESNLHVQLMGPRGDGYFDVAPIGLLNGWGFNYPSAKLTAAFDAAGDVNRKAATLMTEEELVAAGGSRNHSLGTPWGYQDAIRIKYATKATNTTTDGIPELNYTTNWRLFRYAEVLLLAAEAYNKNNQDGLARTELNKVRNRAGLPDVPETLSGSALFDEIVNENFLELAHEGQRFWNLVRWGLASTELAGTGYSSKNDLYPIPLTEIDLNEALTNADQNPGY